METPDLATFIILPSATLLEAAKIIGGNASRTIVVVENTETKKVLGILSEGDILRALISGQSVHAPIQEAMRVSFTYLESGKEDLEKARTLFTEHGFGLLPIVDQDMQLVSVITMLNCLRDA